MSHHAEHAEVNDDVAPERPGPRLVAVQVLRELALFDLCVEGLRQHGFRASRREEVREQDEVGSAREQLADKAEVTGRDVEGGSDEDVEQAEPDDEMARQAFALPDEPEADAVEYQVDEIEDVREFQLVAAFDQERQQRDGDDDVECKEELEDPHEAELLRVAEVFRHGLRLQSRSTDLCLRRASPMALRAQFVQYISVDRRKARSERQMPRSLRRTRRSCRYQRLSVGSRAPMNETASSRVMWHDSAMNGAQRSISSSSVSSSRNAPFA